VQLVIRAGLMHAGAPIVKIEVES
jgi:hypothetical protein